MRTPPSHTSWQNEPRVPEQLDLFGHATVPPNNATSSITADVARASVSPGWWPLVAHLFGHDADGLLVRRCEEVDGALMLDLETTAPRSGEHGDDTGTVEATARRITSMAARTCGACGATRALPFRPRVDAVTRIVCATCSERLRVGESYARLADEHWRLDGSRRTSRATTTPGEAPMLTAPAAAPAKRRPCATLPPVELRRVITEIRESMLREIVGQDEAVGRLAVLAGCRVGGGLARGGRALLIGTSACGESETLGAMRRAIGAGSWDVPWISTDALDLSAPGWSGAPAIGDLIPAGLGEEPPDSIRARHAVVVIDEIHHAGTIEGTHGNMQAKRAEVLASLLGVVGFGTVHLGEGTAEWSSRNALVIAAGAFTGLLPDATRAPSIRELQAAGIPRELASRFEETILLRALGEHALRTLLHRWPALTSLTELCQRLGFTVRIHEEAYRRAAREVVTGLEQATARTAGGWLVSALRHALVAAISQPDVRLLEITPDSLDIPLARARRRPPDDPDRQGGWNATIVLTPR